MNARRTAIDDNFGQALRSMINSCVNWRMESVVFCGGAGAVSYTQTRNHVLPLRNHIHAYKFYFVCSVCFFPASLAALLVRFAAPWIRDWDVFSVLFGCAYNDEHFEISFDHQIKVTLHTNTRHTQTHTHERNEISDMTNIWKMVNASAKAHPPRNNNVYILTSGHFMSTIKLIRKSIKRVLCWHIYSQVSTQADMFEHSQITSPSPNGPPPPTPPQRLLIIIIDDDGFSFIVFIFNHLRFYFGKASANSMHADLRCDCAPKNIRINWCGKIDLFAIEFYLHFVFFFFFPFFMISFIHL